MLKQTPLHAIHRAAGARMVDFGGWDMPVHYGSQIDEHHAVRRAAGMFDVSHMLAVDIEPTGPAGGENGVRDFLRSALANNVDKLTVPGKLKASALRRGVTLTATAPAAGKLKLTLKRGKRTVATGAATAKAAGTIKVKLKAKQGAKLTGTTKLTATFTPKAGKPTTTKATIRVR